MEIGIRIAVITKDRHYTNKNEFHRTLRQALQKSLADMESRCIDCPKCQAECAFLEKYGTPREIAVNYDPSKDDCLGLPYECSLCGLCGAVCPVGLSPEEMFIEMRRESTARGVSPMPEHKRLLLYEKRGTSKLFSYYSLPEKCHTVFFPGCTFTGTRRQQTIGVYEHLKSFDHSLGIVLDCCCKPSHDLGRSDYFSAMMGEMKSFLIGHDVKKIITACPNCYNIFRSYGRPLDVTSVYETLLQNKLPESGRINTTRFISVHDPCVARTEAAVHDAVRKLAVEKGFSPVDMLHSRGKTLCCGEGGNVEAIKPEFSTIWAKRRRQEADGRILLTYCAGCADQLKKHTSVFHILDAVFDPQSIISGKAGSACWPWTYLNRLRVKRYLKKEHPAKVYRERVYSADVPARNKAWARMAFLLALIILVSALLLLFFQVLFWI